MLSWEPKFLRNDSPWAWALLLGGIVFIGLFVLRAVVRGMLP
jgi:hypothetical protein